MTWRAYRPSGRGAMRYPTPRRSESAYTSGLECPPARWPMISMDLSALPRFPCAKDKTPLAKWGGVGGPRNYWPYERHWALAGVPTGGHSGFDVVDIDPDGLDWFHANKHRLPETRAHATPRGGLHLLFHAWPTLRCSVGRIAKGVD